MTPEQARTAARHRASDLRMARFLAAREAAANKAAQDEHETTEGEAS